LVTNPQLLFGRWLILLFREKHFFSVLVQLKSEQLERERNVLRQRWNTECGEKMGVKTKLKARNLPTDEI
jgi:hypothetical protein